MQLDKTKLVMLKKQFNFDSEKYIKENGLVTDKAKAIELLCESNKAWAVIDETLKMDPEIIMYYQPMGYRIDWGWEILLDAGEVITKAYFGEEGFYADMFGRCLQNGYGDAFIPQIDFPEDFDLLTYLKIQFELYLNATLDTLGDSSYFPRAYYKDDIFRKVDSSDNNYYDLQMLKTLVPLMYKPQIKTIGLHPAMQSKTTSEN